MKDAPERSDRTTAIHGRNPSNLSDWPDGSLTGRTGERWSQIQLRIDEANFYITLGDVHMSGLGTGPGTVTIRGLDLRVIFKPDNNPDGDTTG